MDIDDTLGTALVGAAIVGSGAIAGALASGAIAPPGSTAAKTASPAKTFAGALVGGLVVGTGALAYGEVVPEYKEVGTWAGLVALGAVTLMAVTSALRPNALTTTPPPAQVPSSVTG